MSDTSLAPMPDEGLPPLPSPPHHRRHIRYATPETLTPSQFILDNSSQNHRASSNNRRSPGAMSDTPPSVAPPSQLHHVNETVPEPEIEAQDHDRMETDEENEDSDDGDSAAEDTPEPESREPEPESDSALPPPQEDEIMDTTPDIPPIQEPPGDPPPPANLNVVINPASSESHGLHLIQVNVNTPPTNAEALEGQPTPPTDQATRESRQARLRAAERELLEVGELRTAERLRAERTRREGEDGERDDDSDDSTDEAEHPYWVNLKEDTSIPDERELKMIEEAGDEVNALDHEHWEKLVYTPLDDPEYVPTEAGRITWTVKGVHGTPEKPNRERIMRSPSVLIGGYYWNIKYFPHGNDGTEQLSIYIECSQTPYEGAEVAPQKSETSGIASDVPKTTDVAEGASLGSETINADAVPEEEMETAPAASPKSDPKDQTPWGVAAQISCVIYNPDEPRVNASQIGCHRYYNDNPDWGWTRFHGPWDEIHKRQRLQRQALLRNDTLAFTAYIRTIRDDTKALWWHPAKEKPEWDTMAMTGVVGFECQEYQSSAVIAAVSAWMHLSPIQRLVRNTTLPDPVWEAKKRMKPAFEELQELYEDGESLAPSDEHDLSLRGLVSVLNYYGSEVDSKMDVVRIWEHLRRVMNFEASGLDTIEAGNSPDNEQFEDVLLLKQPDLLGQGTQDITYPILRNEMIEAGEPQSVQQTLDRAAGPDNDTNALRVWQSFEGQPQAPAQNPPKVLQIELHRQDFAQEARKWKKLTHRIELNETVVLNGSEYTLYGMIVHTGDLESQEYCSILRPEGPGTRWLKYAGDNHERKVSILTSRQALQAHEGTDGAEQGTAAVAYIVLYVRTNALPDVLCTPFKQKPPANTPKQDIAGVTSPEDDMVDSKDTEQHIPVLVYGSDVFEGYSSRGLCDPWNFQSEGTAVRELSFPATDTIGGVKDRLGGIVTVENPETRGIRLWPINTYITDFGTRTFPSLLPFKTHAEDTLDEMGQHSGGCRFWMTIADKPPAPPPAPETAPTSEADLAREQESHDAALQAVMLSMQAADSQASQTTPSAGEGTAEAVDTEMGSDEISSEENERRRQQQREQEQARQQAQQQAHEQLLLQMQQAQQEQQQLRRIASEQAERRQREYEQQSRETYFLVKLFDADAQTLRGVGCAVVKTDSKIVEEMKKVLQVEGTESWDYYLEHGIAISPKHQVRSHETFEGRCGGADGYIFIAQRRPGAAK